MAANGKYGIGEHGIGKHGIGEYGIGQHRKGKYGIGELGIGEMQCNRNESLNCRLCLEKSPVHICIAERVTLHLSNADLTGLFSKHNLQLSDSFRIGYILVHG